MADHLFPWTCTLTGINKEYIWVPGKTEEEKKCPNSLLIKTAFLMPTAVKDEETVVQIETEGYNKQTVILTLFYLGLC